MNNKLQLEDLQSFIFFVSVSSFLLMLFYYYFENKFKD